MTVTPHTTIRLDAETTRLIDLLAKRLGVGTKTAVIRLAVARLAQAECVATEQEARQ